jgi:hypothetical protein
MGRPHSAGAKAFEIEPLGDYSLEESAGFIGAWHQAPAEGGEPGWFPLIARAAAPQALLSFRYIDGIYFEKRLSWPRLAGH